MDYFTAGCSTDRPALPRSTEAGDRQFNQQHQIQEAKDAAEDVAVDILQESDEIHRVDFLNYSQI